MERGRWAVPRNSFVLLRGWLERPVVAGARTRWAELLLIAWFSALTTLMILWPIAQGLAHPLGIDTIIYTHAARALVEGGDPWHVVVFKIAFAAPPPSLLPYLPFVGLSDEALSWLGTLAALAAAVYSIRKLGMPMWWLLFPPVALGIAAGTSALPMLALLLRGGVIADGAAVVTRIYAALPLAALLRWRSLAVGALGLLITAPFLGWTTYLQELDHVADVVRMQAGQGVSATAIPLLFPLVAGLLLAVGRRRAAWLLVPFLWPNAQLHYASMALPVLADMPLVAVGLAGDSALLAIAGLTAHVVAERTSARIPR